MTWLQHYDPLHNAALSTVVAALPVVVLLSAVAWFRIRIHFAALLGLAVALVIALVVLKGIFVLLQAYVHPFSLLQVR